MKRLLAGVALSALFFASSASAAAYVFNLTGDMLNFTSSSFTVGNILYETGVLELTGFTPFTMQDGDTIDATISISSGPFALPIRDNMFFGLNFDDILGGLQPVTSQSTGSFAFDGGAPVSAGCGNCVSLIYGQNNLPLTFNGLVASGAFTLSDDYAVNKISISYQVNNAAVPEPTAWALMIVGFGGVGALMRRRRATVALTAA